MGELSISELRERTGMAASALRFYERKGLLRASGRAGGKRCYDERAVEQVAFIDLLKSAGFTLAEIAEFLTPRGSAESGWRALTSEKVRQLDEQVARIRQAQEVLGHLLDCRHEHLDDCPEHHRVLRAHAAALATAAERPGTTTAGVAGAPVPRDRRQTDG
ncbi:MerR family transcriptional regulator [Nocardia asteroides]|uniref:MerR family transcriptional regulator n=1 Tax=Nocardia asteroides TaxID=1824 RepID=UPI001E59E3BA|nr:MerR family transcriptional regulator [Nocardia asteroides]UGT55242.1 MerR family transcriptional regulator [Nocardia asteroides]